MAIAFGSSGTGASGTGSSNPTTPSATVDGDIMIAHAVSKYAVPDAPPAGWTLIGSIFGGHGSNGSNTGTVYDSFYYKIAAGDANSTAYTWTVTGGNAIRVNISRYTKAEGDQWVTPAFASVANSGTPSTSWSATATSNPGIASGDIVVVGAAVNSSAFTYSTPVLSATGCTFGTVTNRFANQVNTGDHLEPVMYDASVTAGPATAAPIFTMASSGSATDAPAGATAFVRLRAQTTAVIKFVSKGGVVGGTSTSAPSFPTSISAGNVLLLMSMGKYPTNYPATPSGWKLLVIRRSSSGLSNASNSGDVWVAVYYKIALGTESGTVSMTITSGNVVAAAIFNYSVASGYVADVVAVGGSDDTSHTAVSVAFGASIGMITDDALALFACGNNSVGGQSAAALSAPGMAAQLTNRDYTQSAGGDACRDNTNTLTVFGAATAAPTFSYTAANATVVAAVLVRIRGVRPVGAGDHKYSSGIGRGIAHGVN